MSSVTEVLERLTALHKEGVLTDEEFAAAKQRMFSDGPEEASDEDRDLALAEAERLMELGLIERAQSYYDEAVDSFQRAIDIFQRHGDRSGESRSMGRLASVYRERGQYEPATRLYNEALRIAREIGNKRSEGIQIGNLGAIYDAQGQYEQAMEHFTQALRIAREIGYKLSEGTNLGNLGNIYYARGQYERALEHYTQALDIAREIGDKRSEGIHLANLGGAFSSLERLDEAESAFRQAIPIGDETFPAAAGAFRGSLALLLAQQDKLQETQSLLQAGELQVKPHLAQHAKFLCNKGQVCHFAGDDDGARASLEAAQALAAELKVGDESEVVQTIRELAAMLGEG